MIDQAKLQEHLHALEAAIKQIGDDAASLNASNGADAKRATIGGALASIIGITSQMYGVDEVRQMLSSIVSGPQAEIFWKAQSDLQKSESEPEPEKTLPAAP